VNIEQTMQDLQTLQAVGFSNEELTMISPAKRQEIIIKLNLNKTNSNVDTQQNKSSTAQADLKIEGDKPIVINYDTVA
jgi:hypothetical protein